MKENSIINLSFKVAIIISIAVISYSVYFYVFILLPKNQDFDNCVKSYHPDWWLIMSDTYRLSPTDLCSKGYVYSSTINIIRTATNEIKSQYKDPDNFWIQDKIKSEISNKLRVTLGLPMLVENKY